MRCSKILGLAGAAAMVLMAFIAGSASATTLELNGVTQNKAVSMSMSLTGGNSVIVGRTDGSLAETCTGSQIIGTTESFSGVKVTAPLSTLTFTSCTSGPAVVHKAGQLFIEHESGSTSGTVFSENAEITMHNVFGFTVTCKTNEGTKIGTLTGVSAGKTTLDVSAVFNCGFLLPSAAWNASYTVTTLGLGVSA